MGAAAGRPLVHHSHPPRPPPPPPLPTPTIRTTRSFLALSNRTVTTLAVYFFSRKRRPPFPSLFSRLPHITTLTLSARDLDASLTLLADSGLPLQSLRLFDHTTHFPTEAMRLLGDRMSRTLKSLSFIYFDVLNDDDLAVVAACFPYLGELDVQGRHPYLGHPYLDEFDIEGHSNTDVFVTDLAIFEISTKLKSLVSINLLYQERLTHRSLDYLVSNCPSLRNLELGSYGLFNFIEIDQLDRFDLFGSLSSLHLKRAKFSHRVLVQLSKFGLKLEKLRLYEPLIIGDVTGEILCEFFKSCPSLRHLQLSHFSFPADTNAIEFAASLPNIQIIRLYAMRFVPPTTLLSLLNSCPLLEEIYIACTFLRITLQWFNYTSANFLVRKLDLFCDHDLCDETLKLLVSVCPKLEHLCLRSLSNTTQKGIEAVRVSRNITLSIGLGKYPQQD